MSDIQSDIDVYEEEEYESSDDETEELQESTAEEILKARIEDNKYYQGLLYQLSLPSKYMVHSLIMHRLNSFCCGAEPLVVDEKRQEISNGNYSYDEIRQHLVELACKEIEEGVSPLVFYDSIFNEYRSVNFLDKELLLKIIKDAINLSKD